MASAEVIPASFTTPTFLPLDAIPSVKRKRVPDADIPSTLLEIMEDTPTRVVFDPLKHLNFTPPPKVYTMEEIGLGDHGISPMAVSEPFPLFTEDAVKQMRAEVLSKPVLENCQYFSNIAVSQLRGFAPEYAPFVYDVWRHPRVHEIVSKIAGVELVPQMDFEIANINLSMPTDEQKKAATLALEEKASREADEGVSGCPWEEDRAVVDWHTDSYPFVCVTMLSDCTNMLGGETALRTGTNEIMKIRGPQMGNAVILQGRYIEHQALAALGMAERISMVTSFRPKSALIKDDTVLTTVRSISDLPELYYQYAEYRLENLEERIRSQLKTMRVRKLAKRRFDTANTKAFIMEQIQFLEIMVSQIVDEDKVIKGFTDPNSCLLSADQKAHSKKKVRTASG